MDEKKLEDGSKTIVAISGKKGKENVNQKAEEKDNQKVKPKKSYPVPKLKCAERNGFLFIMVCVKGCIDPEIKIQSKKLYFKGRSGDDGTTYELTLNFLKEIDPENSNYAVEDDVVEFALKKEEYGPYWER